jgi:hypothetical protein
VRVGCDEEGDVYVPLRSLLPMVAPNDLVFSGWDISAMNLGDAMRRAKVFKDHSVVSIIINNLPIFYFFSVSSSYFIFYIYLCTC